MYAVIAEATIQAGHEDEAAEFVKANIVPRVKESPGLVGGYWTAPQGGRGIAISLYETEEAAQGAAEMARNFSRPDYTTAQFEVREVIAQV
jgi:hypothetical protein